MGKRGPAKKPTAIRLAEGNPGRLPINENEPTPEQAVPHKPKILKGEALAEWNRIVPVLQEMGVLTKADGVALANYCLAWARLCSAQAHIDEHGNTTVTPTGHLRKNPNVEIAEAAQRLCKTFLAEFGLSPSSRSGISVANGKAKHGKKEDIKRRLGLA